MNPKVLHPTAHKLNKPMFMWTSAQTVIMCTIGDVAKIQNLTMLEMRKSTHTVMKIMRILFDYESSTATRLVFCMYLKRTSELIQLVTSWSLNEEAHEWFGHADEAQQGQI